MAYSDMDYYREVHRTDPTYTPKHAVCEYLHEHPDLAIELIENSELERPFSYDVLVDLLENMDTIDVFSLGMQSSRQCDLAHDYFDIDGYGHIESMNDSKYKDWCVEEACDQLSYEILEGKVEIPHELVQILGIWDTPFRGMAQNNKRPSPKKTVKKTATRKAPAKKLVKSSGCKPKTKSKATPIKKPANGSVRKSPSGRSSR